MQRQHASERSDQRFKPRYPRLSLLRRRRKDDTWYAVADKDGLLSIRPRVR